MQIRICFCRLLVVAGVLGTVPVFAASGYDQPPKNILDVMHAPSPAGRDRPHRGTLYGHFLERATPGLPCCTNLTAIVIGAKPTSLTWMRDQTRLGTWQFQPGHTGSMVCGDVRARAVSDLCAVLVQ
jgi:hypothetical protein